MSKEGNVVNLPTVTTAPITNVSLCGEALLCVTDRAPHLPGIAAFFGPAGWGKSTAAAYWANKRRAYFIQVKSVWTRKALLGAILKEMGMHPARTLYEMADQVSEQLVLSGRPLIIDEADYLVENNGVELVRDLHESSNAAILLLGEERLPDKLKKWERFHSRVLSWVRAQPVSIDDAEHLARLYCKDVEIATDLLQKVQKLSHGSVRRVAVNIELIREESLKIVGLKVDGVRKIDLATWGDRELYTGEAPPRRAS